MSSINQFIIGSVVVFLGLFSSTTNDVRPIKSTLVFDIISKNKIIGDLKATKIIKDSKVHYKCITSINTRIIKEIQVNYEYDVTFENNKLKKANVLIDINDKPYADILTKWEIAYYQISKNDKNELVVEEDIKYATILLYFVEPVNIERCYSEQDGSFNTIIPLGNHSYKKINSKNHENIYYYKYGFLERAEINGGIVKFEIVVQK
ncbi:DUF6134 family protein [Maribacter sp. Asnod1-A12]|uniref:DUF6134 family protein n=1 Tax=Maribacter sp. Asnod1-A12 TaxID=3160576 RepID=UPI003865D895